MPRYMVSCTLSEPLSSSLITESQQHFLELMKEGYLLSTHVSRDWKKCWLIMQAPEYSFIQNLLKTSPLYDLMRSAIDELEE